MENTTFKFKFILEEDMRVLTFRLGKTRFYKDQLLPFKKGDNSNILEGAVTAKHYTKNNVELSIWGVGKPGTKGSFIIYNEKGEPLYEKPLPLKTFGRGRFKMLKKFLPTK